MEFWSNYAILHPRNVGDFLPLLRGAGGSVKSETWSPVVTCNVGGVHAFNPPSPTSDNKMCEAAVVMVLVFSADYAEAKANPWLGDFV